VATHETPDLHCPHCGRAGDQHTNADRGEHCTPTPGAYSLCLYCGGASRFGPELRLRPATTTEVEAIRREAPDVFAALDAVRQIRIRRGLLERGPPLN
jgi:hypothetical protein